MRIVFKLLIIFLFVKLTSAGCNYDEFCRNRESYWVGGCSSCLCENCDYKCKSCENAAEQCTECSYTNRIVSLGCE